jgi:hypothetical protein
MVLSTYWAPVENPQDFFAALTPIEQNLFTDVTQVKLDDLARAAAAADGSSTEDPA